MGESARHRELRMMVEANLSQMGFSVFSSHGRGDVTLYRLTQARKKGNPTAVKCPDVFATKGDKSVLVEIERSDRPSVILGDIASVSVSTHISPRASMPPRGLEPSLVTVVIDNQDRPPRSSKGSQLEVIREALAQVGGSHAVWIGEPSQFLPHLKQWDRAGGRTAAT